MQNINPRVIGRLNRELKSLTSSPPEGIRFLPGDMDSLSEVHVEMDGPGEPPRTGKSTLLERFVCLVCAQRTRHVPPWDVALATYTHQPASRLGPPVRTTHGALARTIPGQA